MDIRVPNLAEGVSSGTVVSIAVKEGEAVKKGQTLIELETEKAVAPIPSPCDGTIRAIEVSVGDAVAVGKRVMMIAEEGAQTTTKPQEQTPPNVDSARTAPLPRTTPVLRPAARQGQDRADLPAAASPSIRKLAAELGIDLSRVEGSGNGGRITLEDVRAYVQVLQQCVSGSAEQAAPAVIDFEKFGPVTRKPMTSLRKKIAEKMLRSWRMIPHVTQFGEADATRITELRKHYVGAYEQAGARLTLTSFILKAVASTLKKYPDFNSSLDETTGEIVYKNYCHLGLAVDTEHGLIVPVIRDVDQKTLLHLSKDIAELAEKTRVRKVTLDEMQGGTFTVSNQGGLGGSFFTPIINSPEVAILGIGQAVMKPVLREGQSGSALMLPLGLSYDHRVIDGGSAARFISDLIREIEGFEEGAVRLQ